MFSSGWNLFFPQKKLIDLFRRGVKIGTKLSPSILIVGVFGRGSPTDTSTDAFTTEHHSAGIELIILMRKNLCSGFTSLLISYEKEWFSVIKSPIFTKPQFTMSLLYTVH